MLILAFESSAKTASVALYRDGILAQSFQNCGLTHSRTLLPMAESMLANSDISISDLDIISVAQGPGSFTGIRIGVSTVKGLAWAADKPVCGVSTLEAMAWNGVSAPEGSIICCAMDARRGQFYNALFEIAEGKPHRLCDDRAISASDLCEDIKKMGKNVFVLGDGAILCYNALQAYGISVKLAPENIRHQSAWGVCMATLEGQAQSVHELLPVYLRLSQAERERQEKLK